MDNRAIIRLLNDDLKREHSAIIQYLQHAYILGEGEVRDEIEEIAREEMYHFQWLAEAVAALLGDPSTERYEVFLEAPTPVELMEHNIRIEGEAIAFYEDHLRQIDRPEIKAVIGRIIRDERQHQAEFRNFQALLQGVDFPALVAAQPRLNEAFKQEYANTLHYLHQSYVAPSCEFRRRMGDLSIENMKYMGWVAERMVDLGGTPDPAWAPIRESREREEILGINRERLRQTGESYQAIKEEADPDTLQLVERIQDNEQYQAYAFEHGPEFPTASPLWTVGPLKK